jgi:hypothetical protein
VEIIIYDYYVHIQIITVKYKIYIQLQLTKQSKRSLEWPKGATTTTVAHNWRYLEDFMYAQQFFVRETPISHTLQD